MFVACVKGDVDALRLLLDKGADVNRADEAGVTPLFIVCLMGHVDAVRLLLEKGVDVDRPNNKGQTPLHVACRKGHEECVKLLLEANATVELPAAASLVAERGSREARALASPVGAFALALGAAVLALLVRDVLERERQSRRVALDDLRPDGRADGQQLPGVSDVTRGQLRDVNHRVLLLAHIDERTEARHVGDHTRDHASRP